jgi:hypothetical protein
MARSIEVRTSGLGRAALVLMKMPFSGGLPETACGAGSTLALTRSVREWLPDLFRHLDVQVLLDAPCGDANWITRTNLAGIDYVGCDYDQSHLNVARSREFDPQVFAPRSKIFVELDIVSDPLPVADVMLCREFLQHLPNALAVKVLRNVLAAGIPWLLATSHNGHVNTDIADVGMFRPLNLVSPPFNLSAPQRSVEDEPGSGRILGLWHRSDLARVAGIND